jgi:hypothetical protein
MGMSLTNNYPNSFTVANTVSCGNLFVTVFAAPYLDSLVIVYKSQTSNNFIILPRSHYQPHTTLQILRRTRLAPGQLPWPIGTIDWPVAAPGNTNYHNCRAVRGKDKGHQ